MAYKSEDDALVQSALCVEGVNSERDVLAWVASRSRAYNYSVERIALEKLDGWAFDRDTGNLSHASGKFFRVEGVDVRTNVGHTGHWTQPIINQPEIGILGFVGKRLNGVLHVLAQAKMEPGNVNLVQISPTVQATRSNYTRVHGGRLPAFVQYFLGHGDVRILADTLQSEQGTRYLRKRNRNVIVEVAERYELPRSDDFLWLTIGQLQRLMRHSNVVHLDCRSILGGLSYERRKQGPFRGPAAADDSFGKRVLASQDEEGKAEQSLSEVLGWLTRHKCRIELQADPVPLRHVEKWGLRDGAIEHETGSFFSIVGVRVRAESREVATWTQPLVHSAEGGVLALVAQMRGGVLHFLIQLRVEPGFLDIAELAPTVQCAPVNYLRGIKSALPPFLDLVTSATRDRIRFDSVLSEEGGRFYHSQQRHLVVELEPHVALEVPPTYIWMTVRQLRDCARFSNLLNIELRSILACVSVAD